MGEENLQRSKFDDWSKIVKKGFASDYTTEQFGLNSGVERCRTNTSGYKDFQAVGNFNIFLVNYFCQF